jgi:hypothetical protein
MNLKTRYLLCAILGVICSGSTDAAIPVEIEDRRCQADRPQPGRYDRLLSLIDSQQVMSVHTGGGTVEDEWICPAAKWPGIEYDDETL